MRRFGPSPVDIFAGCLVLVVVLAVTLLPILNSAGRCLFAHDGDRVSLLFLAIFQTRHVHSPTGPP